jgi:hypothetical protein
MPEDQAAIYQLAFEEARRAVADQVGALDNLRGRAGTLLAVASLSTSLLGGIVLQGNAPHGWLSWAAIGVFVGVVAITLVLLLPRPRWGFSISATTIIEGYAEGEHPRDLATTHRYLALHLEGADTKNAARLNHLYWWFIAASGLLGAEILLWLIVLIRR